MNEAQIDLQQLRIKHILFKSKVRSVAYGGAFDENFFSTTGPVSTWFTTASRKYYAQSPELLSLKQLSMQLSSLAEKIYKQYTNGDIDQAHEGLAEVEKVSERFQSVLAMLESRLANAG